MAPFVPLFAKEPRYPLDKPATPSLIAKIDRLSSLFQEAMILRKEIEQDWIKLTREEKERFVHLSASSQIRSSERKPTAKPHTVSDAPRKRRNSLLEQIERFPED
jgi:hypothetical protein